MSTSSAPAATAARASAALISAVCLPEGKPQTTASFTAPSSACTGSMFGDTQIEKVPNSTASAASFATSSSVASVLSRVWSM